VGWRREEGGVGRWKEGRKEGEGEEKEEREGTERRGRKKVEGREEGGGLVVATGRGNRAWHRNRRRGTRGGEEEGEGGRRGR
jgi:hypothetical protein